MPGAELRGTGRAATYPNSNKAYKKGGRIKAAHGTTRGRENLLEELGRVEAEKSNRNRRDEVRRVHHELNKGLRGGGIAKKGKGVAL
jgi:hypothetical protein